MALCGRFKSRMLPVMLLVSWEVFGGKKPARVAYIYLNKIFLNVTFATLKRRSKIKNGLFAIYRYLHILEHELSVYFDYLGTKIQFIYIILYFFISCWDLGFYVL